MTGTGRTTRVGQRGMVLVTSLLLLLVVTILALSMFRSFGIQEKIAGNLREKQRAVHAAETAQQYAEWWLSTGSNAATAPITCNAVLDANLNQGQICSNKLTPATAIAMPWPGGVLYKPSTMTVTSSNDIGTYASKPQFYISALGAAATGQGQVFKVDAVGYGGSQNSVAVVESTFQVYVSSWSLE